jgi:phosphatidylserine decarboxylase
MFAQGGHRIILFTLAALLLSLLFTFLFPTLFTQVLSSVIGILFLFHLFFFRDPERDIPQNENLIVSPADGKVVQIEQVIEPEYFKNEVQRVSIFLSIFDVHVNRTPISGTVDYFKYIPGKFFVAFESKASELNEQTVIGIRNGNKRILFKQIAGIIARRIICDIGEGDSVMTGQRCGMIKYGSRVDIFYPDNARITVQVGDRVAGGRSVIGEFK